MPSVCNATSGVNGSSVSRHAGCRLTSLALLPADAPTKLFATHGLLQHCEASRQRTNLLAVSFATQYKYSEI
eukprot:scaffold15251_cov214-Alexandrium_tamarense.AAC.4